MSPTGEIFNQCKLSPWIPDHEGYDDDNIDCNSDDNTDDDQEYDDHDDHAGDGDVGGDGDKVGHQLERFLSTVNLALGYW